MPDAAIFADTHWEPQAVYDNLKWLESVLPFPIIRVDNGRNLKVDVHDRKGYHEGMLGITIPVHLKMPDGSMALNRRTCTDHYKVQPVIQAIRSLLGYKPRQRVRSGVVVEQWMGISFDEWTRMRTSRLAYIRNRYPLVDMRWTRDDCGDWFQAHYPSRSIVKSACAGCPFRSNESWLDLLHHSPSDFEDAAIIDASLRQERERPGEKPLLGQPFLHRSGKPLAEGVSDYAQRKSARQLTDDSEDLWDNECEGYCHV